MTTTDFPNAAKHTARLVLVVVLGGHATWRLLDSTVNVVLLAGFARIVSNTVVGGQTYSSPAVNKGGVSISGGANIPIGGNSGRQWGLRFEGRGLKLADFNPWIGQFSAGLYLRF